MCFSLTFPCVGRYTKALLPLAAFVVPYYIIFRVASWAWYVRTLTLVGISVPLVWAPIWLNQWKNLSDNLDYDWGLRDLPDTSTCVALCPSIVACGHFLMYVFLCAALYPQCAES